MFAYRLTYSNPFRCVHAKVILLCPCWNVQKHARVALFINGLAHLTVDLFPPRNFLTIHQLVTNLKLSLPLVMDGWKFETN